MFGGLGRETGAKIGLDGDGGWSDRVGGPVVEEMRDTRLHRLGAEILYVVVN